MFFKIFCLFLFLASANATELMTVEGTLEGKKPAQSMSAIDRFDLYEREKMNNQQAQDQLDSSFPSYEKFERELKGAPLKKQEDLFFEDLETMAQYPQEAFNYYLKGAKKGGMRSQCNLGTMHVRGWIKKNGEKVTPWPGKAVKYFLLSAKQGYARAQKSLADMYRSGWVRKNGAKVAPNFEKAKEYYTLAAKQKLSGAQKSLADMYKIGWVKKNGVKVAPNFEKAKEYYALAAKQGDPSAKAELNRLNGKMH